MTDLVASREFFDRELAGTPFLAIFRGLPATETLDRARRAWAAGVRLIEVPVQDEAGWDAFLAVSAAAEGRPVGVGTVLDIGQVARAADSGAAFCVSPGLDVRIGLAAADAGLAHLPGVATATDVTAALAAGYRWLKAFPASVLGPEWIRAMLGPFPHGRFVCTGGMTPESWPEYRDAGAAAAAMSRGWD